MKMLLILFTMIATATVWAIPSAPFDALAAINLKKIRPLTAYDFEGIVKLSNCSGALVILEGVPETAPALVMTNGHCIQKPGGYLKPGEVWVNRPISRSMRLFDSAMNLFPITSNKIAYATMTNTDLAFYELDQSYPEIKKQTGVSPLILDPARAMAGDEIEIISGYWDRGYSCAIDAFVHQVREGSWLWTDSLRYTSTCDTVGGTSGSPIIARGERRIVGINNTSNRDGGNCTLNNPCEVDESGAVYARQGLRYGQQIHQVYSCLTPDFRIDLAVSSCELPRPEKE